MDRDTPEGIPQGTREGIPEGIADDLQDCVRTLALRSPDHRRVGPFVLRYNPDWDIPPANYAIPDAGAAPTKAEIDELVAAFRELERVPRLEFQPACAPELEPALLAAGFTVERRAPLMACAPGGLREPGPVEGIAFDEPADDAAYAAAASVQNLAYGGTGEANAGAIRWLRTAAAGGGVAGIATDTADGTTVGAGGCSVPVDGLSELAGLAVAASHRRRGIGGNLSAYLTATAFARGCRLVWLEPADASIERIYAGIGYRRVSEKVDISLAP
ncbi:GNAT family N-acetyltransferase [Streptomyces sp. NPDC093546]|uniref:GNAT family N-acetyltransferase n=1 Tax=Streptomyces sp. NPDC093546 TaxID=3366040 RepID=UPI00381AD58E